MPSVATWSQNPDAVGVPAFRAQNAAIRVWSSVRVSESCRISASPAVNAADPNAGGGPGRNWLADVRNQGNEVGSEPPAIVGGVVLLIQSPTPVGMVPVNGALNPSVRARATISAPAARPISAPRENAGCGASPPGPALACAVTASSNA